MSVPRPTMPPADRLTTACYLGDVHSAEAALEDGASVNEPGNAPCWRLGGLPLHAAARSCSVELTVWLLQRGADPNGDRVMWSGAWYSTLVLQLLLDAGGDPNRESWAEPPLVTAVRGATVDRDRGTVDSARVALLLAQPALSLWRRYDNKTMDAYARDCGKPELAELIEREVSERVQWRWR